MVAVTNANKSRWACVASRPQPFSGGSHVQDAGFLQKAPGQHDAGRPGLLPVSVGRIGHRHLSQHTRWVAQSWCCGLVTVYKKKKNWHNMLYPSQKLKMFSCLLIMRHVWLLVHADMREPVFEFIRPPVYHPPQVRYPKGQPLRYLDRYRDGKEHTYGIYWLIMRHTLTWVCIWHIYVKQ